MFSGEELLVGEKKDNPLEEGAGEGQS